MSVVMPSAINDLAFSQSMYDALVAIQNEMGKDKFEFVYSDGMFVVVTSDNPRGEDPRRIAAEIAAGARSRCEIELDRARAIRAAVADAAQGDVVLVAGKGHEAWQEVAGRRLPFRDRTVAAAALARWRP